MLDEELAYAQCCTNVNTHTHETNNNLHDSCVSTLYSSAGKNCRGRTDQIFARMGSQAESVGNLGKAKS